MEIEHKQRPAAKMSHTDGSTNEDVYHVHKTYGTAEIRVPAGTPVTMEDTRWGSWNNSTDPRKSLPNMEIRDGAMIIPLSDVIQEIIARSEPIDIARALLEDHDVKEELIYGLSERYSQTGIDDQDRRKFLRKVEIAVHSKALDRLASAMETQEYAARNKAHYYAQGDRFGPFWRSVMETLDLYPEAKAAVLRSHGAADFSVPKEVREEFAIGGLHWNQARDYWRKRVEELFPTPDEVVEEKPKDDIPY